MRKLVVFNNVTLDGYFTGVDGDFSWAHSGSDDAEFNGFVADNASGGGQLLLGRITYELMASYWPTPNAIKNDPIVAEGMNSMPKVVFSRTLDKASWSNTKLVKGDIAAEIRKMKQEPGKGMAILGSGSIVSQLAPHGLIDEYQSRGQSRRSGPGTDDVRRCQREVEPEADQDPELPQWEGLPVLRVDGVTQQRGIVFRCFDHGHLRHLLRTGTFT